MDVMKAQSGVGLQTLSGVEGREQAEQNAVASLQARYGEKPKEARVIKKALDKDDFMRIMITEMKHQDPTKPMDSDRMATQMAQITSVEQMKNVSNAVEKLADKNSASDRMAMSGMIGKSVIVDKGRFNHQKGTLSPINFDLPTDAAKIKVTVLDEKGDEVSTHELDPKHAGPNIFSWDGINASGIAQKSATYTVRVDAEDAKGVKIKVDPISKESIVGVSFEGGDTNFLVGDPKSPQTVNFRNVIRIEADAGRPMNQASAAGGVPGNTAAAPKPNSEFALPPQLKEKLGLMAKADPSSTSPGIKNDAEADDAAPVKAEGFANGLRE